MNLVALLDGLYLKDLVSLQISTTTLSDVIWYSRYACRYGRTILGQTDEVTYCTPLIKIHYNTECS